MPAGPGNVQQYGLFGEVFGPGFAYHCYSAPNLFFNKDFSNLYLGRIYSSAWGWSQYTTFTGQHTIWATAVNTSVWDTLTAAATIDTAGSQALALRIHAGGRLKVKVGKDLTCTGATEINEPQGLWIASDASGTASFIDNGTITYNTGGTARVDRYFTPGFWHFWSMAVGSSTSAPFYSFYMRYYDEPTHQFQQITTTGVPLHPTQGYSVWANGTNTTAGVSGALNTGTMTTQPLTSTLIGASVYDGYNMIGNPYPSSVDWTSAGYSRTNTEPVKYSYNVNQYQTYNAQTGESTNGGDKYVKPEQGFFVHVTDNTTGSVSVNNTARLHLTGSYNKKSSGISDMLILTASANGIADETHIVFNSDATVNFDPDFDAYKMTGASQAPNLYSRLPGNIQAAVNWLPRTGASQLVPLGFTCGPSGVYHITASNLGSFNSATQIFLEDLKENNTQNLVTDPDYHFTYAAGESPNRFLLHFSSPTLDVNDQQPEKFQVYAWEDAVYVKMLTTGEVHGTVALYDLAGKMVFSGGLANLRLNKFRPALVRGLYLVKVQTSRSVVTDKIFINQQ